jgi:hypothetical protein
MQPLLKLGRELGCGNTASSTSSAVPLRPLPSSNEKDLSARLLLIFYARELLLTRPDG